MTKRSASEQTARLNRTLGILLVAQLVVVGVVYLGGDSPKAPKAEQLFAGLKADDVNLLKVYGDKQGEVVELAKSGDDWLLRSGGDYPAQSDKVKEMIGKLAALSSSETVTEQQSHQRKLEVADDKYQRKVEIQRKGGKPLTFFIGSSPAFKRVHVRLAGEKAVHLAGEFSAWDLSTNAGGWVDTQYFKTDSKQVVSLSLKNNHGTITLTRAAADQAWALEGLPAGQKLKSGDVDGLVNAATAITLEAPLGKNKQADYGFDNPLATLTLVTEKPVKAPASAASDAGPTAAPAPERQTVTILVGAKVGDSYYLKASNSPFYVKVGSWVARPLVDKKRTDLSEAEKAKQPQGQAHSDGPGASQAS